MEGKCGIDDVPYNENEDVVGALDEATNLEIDDTGRVIETLP